MHNEQSIDDIPEVEENMSATESFQKPKHGWKIHHDAVTIVAITQATWTTSVIRQTINLCLKAKHVISALKQETRKITAAVRQVPSIPHCLSSESKDKFIEKDL